MSNSACPATGSHWQESESRDSPHALPMLRRYRAWLRLAGFSLATLTALKFIRGSSSVRRLRQRRAPEISVGSCILRWKYHLQTDHECHLSRGSFLFKHNRVFLVWFEVDLPDAVGFNRWHGSASQLNSGDALAVRRPQFELASDARAQRCGDRPAVLLRCVHLHVPAGAESAKAAFRPGRRQRRQKCDFS